MDEWVEDKGVRFLRRIGVSKGQAVLDFGCNEGRYTRPAARAVGRDGIVYAVDKNKEVLDALKGVIDREGLSNVECMLLDRDGEYGNPSSTSGQALDQNDVPVLVDIPIPDATIDVALVYDVLHGGYFPESKQRIAVLQEIRRVLKPDGLFSLYPTHLKKFNLTYNQILEEVQETGFQLEDKARRRLVHDGIFTRGWVFNFCVNEGQI
jgi:ubiquinone/menaquinone biosynthesis C-methylase UbiE